ncbi:hypothetical protein B0T20DRAFT_99309 [Sordaria brevicollis]|uniref:Uncharacterized protein n=1 Tax=Sordaria brevicollis TaxID=83679 RepID=A0AAE0NWA5_SORBR|nr:hypothetical protein B0T20DRAFT_99309 [Sordaria brevicollis]
MVSESASPFRLPIAMHCLPKVPGSLPQAAITLTAQCRSFPQTEFPKDLVQGFRFRLRVSLVTVSTSPFQQSFCYATYPPCPSGLDRDPNTYHNDHRLYWHRAVEHGLYLRHSRPVYSVRAPSGRPTDVGNTNNFKDVVSVSCTCPNVSCSPLGVRVTSTVCDGLGVGREVMRPKTPNGVIFSSYLTTTVDRSLIYPRSIAAVRIDPSYSVCMSAVLRTVPSYMKFPNSPVGVRRKSRPTTSHRSDGDTTGANKQLTR